MAASRWREHDRRVLRLHDVVRHYRRGSEVVTAVDDVSFELETGTVTALVGPSGAGKTTLLNLVLGGDRPDGGTIEGVPDQPRWSELAIVPQALGLLPELTIAENVDLPRRLRPHRPRQRRRWSNRSTPRGDGAPAVAELLAALDIGELADRPPNETSLGQQQRAAVARALIVRPAVWRGRADEPSGRSEHRPGGRRLRATRTGRHVVHPALHARSAGGGTLRSRAADDRRPCRSRTVSTNSGR